MGVGDIAPLTVQPLQNGGEVAISPHNHHKRIKRNTMSSMSSVDDEAESVAEEGDQSVNHTGGSYYVRSPSSLNSSAGWHGQQQQGASVQPGEHVCLLECTLVE